MFVIGSRYWILWYVEVNLVVLSIVLCLVLLLFPLYDVALLAGKDLYM